MLVMIALILATALQYGSCQSGGPDRSRTTAVVAGIFLEGLAARKPDVMRWVTRRGVEWRNGDSTITDADVYAELEVEAWPVRRLVVTGLIVNGSNAAATTEVQGHPESETLTVLTVEGGCVTEVRVFGPTESVP